MENFENTPKRHQNLVLWAYPKFISTPKRYQNEFNNNKLYNVSVKSKLQHAPPPPGIPRAFDTFAVPGRGEFDYQSLPWGGEFDPHALGVGDLNCTLDFL